MKKNNLGNTSLKVSKIGLGCWQLGGLTTINNISTTYGDVDEKKAKSIISEALDQGINVFDTADSYSLGNSERRLGKLLKGKRDKIYIFTKAGNIPTYDLVNPFEIDLSFNHLIGALDRSLKRLQTDYVDLFQAHKAPRNKDDFKQLEKTFEKVKDTKKAKFCGVSIGREYEKGIELIEKGLVDSLQVHLSLLDYEPIENLLQFAKKKKIGIIASEPLAQGFLTGKYQENHTFPKQDVRSNFEKKILKERIRRAKEFSFLENNHRKLNQAALAYVIQLEGVSTCIPGAKSVKQLKSNVETLQIKINQNDLKRISNIHKKWTKNKH